MSKFLCSSCGACCYTDMKKRGAEERGLPIKKDGSCAHLVGNLCSIYENRHDVCNSEKMAALAVKKSRIRKLNGKKYTEIDFYKTATKECHKLIDKAGLDEKYKIDLKEYDK